VFPGAEEIQGLPALAAVGGIPGPVGSAVLVVALVPGSILTLAAGAIFGLAEGAAWVFIGASLGATAAFVIARYVARGWVERRIGGKGRFAAIDRAIGREGLKIAFLLRLTPVVPFTLQNYFLGLTSVRLPHYVLALLGMIPGTVLYVYAGAIAGDAVSAAGEVAAEAGAPDWATWTMNIVAFVATVAVVIIVTRVARRALKEEVGD